MSDTPDEPLATDPVLLYAISEVALEDIEHILIELGTEAAPIDQVLILGKIEPRADRALGFIRAARQNGPIKDPEPVYITGCTASDLASARKQRDFLMGQVDSLIQRLSGAHVAAGLLAMPAAQGFMQKEVFPINQALAQIEQPS